MSNFDITRLVVGESLAISLGKPVGQDIKPKDVSKILRLRNGRWEGVTGVNHLLRKGGRRSTNTFSIQSARQWKGWPWIKLIAVLGSITLVGATLGAIYSHQPARQEASIPVMPAVTQGVRIVDQPFAPQEPELLTIIRADEAGPMPEAPVKAAQPIGLPIVPPTPESAPVGPAKRAVAAASPAVAATPPASPVPASPQVKTQALPAGKPPAPAPAPAPQPIAPQASKPADQPKPPAVIFDDISSKPPVTSTPTPASGREAIEPTTAATPPLRRAGTGLVAITPDGKSAIFTNPQTRLPEQFKIGEKLHGGEVIMGIDTAEGKVITNMKEYSLE